jgi:hypothetical protein
MPLSASQESAISCVAASARSLRANAVGMQEHICRMSDIAPTELRALRDDIQSCARVAVHFHPDRPCADGVTVAQSMLRDGCYRSQYETRISNGGLSAHAGGQRDVCEQRLFGGAYHADGVTGAERPKYGSLQLLRHAEGPSPRFGSCYFVLAPAVSQRCTFTHLDSHQDPKDIGTIEEPDAILAALLRDAFLAESVFGVRDLAVPALVQRLRSELQLPLGSHALAEPVRNLNYYVEAQVHGAIDLGSDAEVLVADPSFRETETGEVLRQLCQRYGVQLHWHHGFLLEVAQVPRDFRGPTMPSLAVQIARSGTIDASVIGTAVHQLRENPAGWGDRGGCDEVLQELKLLWHVLVRYGRTVARPTT